MFNMKSIKCIIVGLLMTGLFVSDGSAQGSYPGRSITVVVPWTAGMADIATRSVCRVAEKVLGQPMIIENKPGAAGALGTNYFLKAAPDGYTIGITAASVLALQPHFREMPFNPLTDVTDICAFVGYPLMLAVRSDTPWRTYGEVINYVRNNPGKFKYATAGSGTFQHIVLETLAKKEGLKWTMIPFKGGAEAVLACLGGHADGIAAGPTDLLPHIKAEKLRGTLSLNNYRWEELPDVPNMSEKGYDFYATQYLSFAGPKGLSDPIRQKLEDAFKKATEDPSIIEWSKKTSAYIQFLGGREYSQIWRSKYDTWGKVIKNLGIKQD
jgi:tripartite-type tricarboxylate transporter receptor subunit TctC